MTKAGKVTSDTSDNTKDDAGPGVDKTRSRSSSDKTGDGTGAPANHGPFASQTEIKNAPSHSSKHGSEARVPASHDGTKVGTEGRTTVETEPAEPEEHSTKSNEGDVVRTEVHHHLLVTSAENPGVGKSGHTGANLDRNTTSVVENTVSETPAVGVPDPVGKRAVDESGPEKDEDHAGNNTTSLSNSTDCKSTSDSAEHHLVERVEQSRDEGRSNRGSAPDLHETEVLKVADERVVGGCREGEGETPEVPLEDDDREGHHDDPEHGES
ncbi:hypothetical protein HG530_004866 [Fusarium avenaceum]|nr:hypothetical protein HG530_004866 [Fusarium avenaceum]